MGMIRLIKRNKDLWLNTEQIESMRAAQEGTIVAMVSGDNHLVSEPTEEILALISLYGPRVVRQEAAHNHLEQRRGGV